MKKLLLGVMALLMAFTVQAQEPVPMVQATYEQIRAALDKEDGSNTQQIKQELIAVIYPKFDFTRMTALAVGRPWREATPEQKTALTDAFRDLMTDIYFNTMLRFKTAQVTVNPQAVMANDGKEATVKTQAKLPNDSTSVMIDYVLYNTAEGWKVFNVNVESSSLVTVYRHQFAEQINKGGIDGLIASLRNKSIKPE